MSEGFKQTEVGPLPSEWEVVQLGERASFRTGPFGSALHKSDYTIDGVPVINPMHLIDGRIVPTSTMTVTEDAAELLSDFRLKPQDIIIGRRGEMGRCAVVREKNAGWLCGTGSMIVRSPTFDSDFLQRALASPRSIAAIESTSVGSTMINLNQSVLSALKVQCPPLDEQRSISEALRDIDSFLSALDRVLVKKRAIKHGAMQQLLTGRTRLPGFTEHWGEGCLGEMGSWRGGMTPSMANPDYWLPGTTPWITSGDVKTLFLASTLSSVSDAAIDERATTIVPACSVIVVMRSGILRRRLPLALNLIDMAVNQDIKALTPNSNVSAHFVLYSMTLNSDRILGKALKSGTTVESLDFRWLKAFEIQIPSIAEQDAIAKVLLDLDAEIANLEQRRGKWQVIRTGMVQALLTGRARVPFPATDEVAA